MGLTFKFLHIGLMFLAVGLELGSELLLHRVARSGDVRAIQTVFRLAGQIGKAVPVLFGLGILLGVADIIYRNFNPWAPWLLFSYAYAIYAFLAGGLIRGPWAMKVGRAAANNQDNTPSEELLQLIDNRLVEILLWVSTAGIVLMVFVMMFKPGGMVY